MRWMIRSWKKLLLVGVSGMSLLPSPALAQDTGGKFNLPMQVRWGTVTLPAGAYSYSVEHRGSPTVLVRSATGGPSVIVLVSSVSTVETPETARLVLQRAGNDWYVASMFLGGEEEELLFIAPPERTEAAQVARLHPAKLAALPHP